MKQAQTLIINAGSSSLKTALYENDVCLFRCDYERIGTNPRMCVEDMCVPVEVIDAAHALRHNIEYFRQKGHNNITRVVHRVVHGGEFFTKPTLITAATKEKISALSILAPLHNPHNLACIEIAQKNIPEAKHIAVFDTAYHQTIPESSYRYAIPQELYSTFKIRKYGFHGISHAYLAKTAAKLLKKKNAKIITCHLGNGASITANKNQKSIDTSMGFTPTDGLLMGTRCGRLDPEVPLFLLRHLRTTPQKVHDILTFESGLRGLTGKSDLREALKKKEGKLAIDMLALQVKGFIGEYHAKLNGADAIVFSGGIGESAWYVREKALLDLENLGIRLDKQKNKKVTEPKKEVSIHAKTSKVKIFVIPANEEEQMLLEAKRV